MGKPAMVMVSVPPQSNTSGVGSNNDTFTVQANTTASTNYVFDAVLTLEHDQRLVKTQHPVQTMSDLSSHAYLMPAHLVMFVLMSNVSPIRMGAPGATVTPFSGNPDKSVAAYQQMLTLQASRQPLTVTTRLRTYTSMVVLAVTPVEDSKTITGLRMRVEFEQILTASTAPSANSARSNTTASTGLGSVSPQPTNPTTSGQFAVPSGTVPVQAPGAGSYTSNSGQDWSQVP